MSTQYSAEYLAEDRGPTIIAVNATITGVADLIVIARIVARWAYMRQIGRDDWIIIIASILATGNIVIAGESVRLGTGKHVQAIPEANRIPAGICRFATRVVYFLISGTIKLSVCFLYLRIFPFLEKHIWVLVAFVVCCSIAQEFATIFQCVPVAGVWDTAKYPHARCINNVAFSYSAQALSAITDIWTWMLPIPTVWSLRMSRRKRLAVIATFSLGLIACIAGIIRMVFLITLLTSDDQPWDTFTTSIASGIEMAVGVITASLPAVNQAFGRMLPGSFSRNTSKPSNAGVYELSSTGREDAVNSKRSRTAPGKDGDSMRAIMEDQAYSSKGQASNISL